MNMIQKAKEQVQGLTKQAYTAAVKENLLPDGVTVEPSVLRYSNFWSTTTPDGDTREAAQEILAYLLSNYAQDQLYLQAGCPGLPLEKTALDNYVSVRHAFQPVFGSISNLHFCK